MRKLILAAVMALAAMAFMAPTAFADSGVEVVDEATGTMCDDTKLGYCEDEIVAKDASLEIHTIFGTITYVCDVHIAVHVQTDGTGASESETITDSTGGTGNCEDLDECMEPWTASMEEEVGEEAIRTNICVTNLLTCEGTLDTHIVESPPHHYSAEIHQKFTSHTGTTCEFEGSYSLANDSIEIKHL